MQSDAADRTQTGLVDGFNFQRTYTNIRSDLQNDAVGVNNNTGLEVTNNDDNNDDDNDFDNDFDNDDNDNDYDNSGDDIEYDMDDDDNDCDNDNDDIDYDIDDDDNNIFYADDADGGNNYDDGNVDDFGEDDDDGDEIVIDSNGDNEDGDDSLDDVADMRLDGLGDTSMSSRASTGIDGCYRDGVEIHKIPDHSMFLRTITHRDIRPILIVEVKRLSPSETRRPLSINDLDLGVFSDAVRKHAKVVIAAAGSQVKAQVKCVFGEFGPDSISFVNALVVAGPYYQRYIITRPEDGQRIVLRPESAMKELFDHSLSEITDDFYEDWKDICRSYDLHTL